MVKKEISLLKGRESSLIRRHPWIFSGAIAKHSLNKDMEDGDIVYVRSNTGAFLCVGQYSDRGSIAIRILSFDEIEINEKFWQNQLANAIQYRKTFQIPCAETNAYRLIHGEGDNLPGLIIDIYDTIAVVQCHSTGMYRQAETIATALHAVLPDLVSIYLRARDTIGDKETADRFLLGHTESVKILENGIPFFVDVVKGQKTGFFLDQRENRALVGRFAKGKSVLNCFSYTGGFSMYALQNGATTVVSVDISPNAIEASQHNAQLLQGTIGSHEAIAEDVLSYLQKHTDTKYDIVIVDPPAFAKSLSKRHNAVQAYKRLNIAALKTVNNGGLMFTFSCSQVIHTQLFTDTIIAAGIEAGRKVRIMQYLSQGADHPINLFHPEGHYLKGLLVYVE
ncbi:MAG: class I SAM-dependent rRNA methyltransferase [Saprospiraceae bacterium]